MRKINSILMDVQWTSEVFNWYQIVNSWPSVKYDIDKFQYRFFFDSTDTLPNEYKDYSFVTHLSPVIDLNNY